MAEQALKVSPTSGSAPVSDAPARSESVAGRQPAQFTLRAVVTGMLLGGVLSVCNVYLGLKSGLVVNMSLVAALVGYGFWAGTRGMAGGHLRRWGILENNINQTAASAGASVASAGLVHAVPAWAMLTGQTLSAGWLILWIFSVCLVGITVAVALRRHLVVDSQLPFPVGQAGAEVLRELHERGAEAIRRVAALAAGAVVGASVYLLKTLASVGRWSLPFSVKGVEAKVLTFTVDPALLWVGVGGLIGFRASASVLIGSVVALGVIAPILVEGGVVVAAGETLRYSELQAWLMWPGAALMVASSLTSLAFSWRSAVAAFRLRRTCPTCQTEMKRGVSFCVSCGHQFSGVPWRWLLGGAAGALALSVALQVTLFEIAVWAAAVGVVLAFVLAVVAARVSGETGITPVGSMGKISQFAFGMAIPNNPVPNLMAANVSGGAASQCADLLHDLKCGQLLGASPRYQALAQVCGAAFGAMVGSLALLLLVPNLTMMLGTAEWPAPGVMVWKTVAELFKDGLAAMPQGSGTAAAIGGMAGVLLTVVEKTVPQRLRPYMPSPASVGLAFVIPAYYAISLFIGGSLAAGASRVWPKWSKRFLMAICAGVIAGESLAAMGLLLTHYLLP